MVDPIGTCPKCGANLALVGRLHRCHTLGGLKPTPGVSNKPPVSNSVSNNRLGRWRSANQDRYRAYMREYMRRRRERAREGRQ